MIIKVQKFLSEIREGDEASKKRWLVVLTSASMLVVIIFWTLYISAAVPQIGSSNRKVESVTFTSTINNVASLTGKNLGLKLNNLIDNLKTLAGRTNSITIEGASFNFVVNGLEKVSPKKLP